MPLKNLTLNSFKLTERLFTRSQNFLSNTIGFQLSIYFPVAVDDLYDYGSTNFSYSQTPDIVQTFPIFGAINEGFQSEVELDNLMGLEEVGFYAPVGMNIPENSKAIMQYANSTEIHFRISLDKGWDGFNKDMVHRFLMVPTDYTSWLKIKADIQATANLGGTV